MKKKLLTLCCILPAVCCALAAHERSRESVTFSSRGLDLLNVSAERDSAGEFFRLKDVSYEGNPDPFFTDIVFSFRKGADESRTDDTGRYDISYASYENARDAATAGERAALFYKQEHHIAVAPRPNLWLSSHNDLGSFTIEMRICPLVIREGSVLFSRIGYSSGTKNGIEIRLHDGRAAAYLYGIFSDESGRRIDRVMTGRTRLTEKKWQHYALSYDRVSGKLSQIIDGNEDSAQFLTATGEPCEGAFKPSFAGSDMPSVLLAKSYSGYLDEFRISYRSYDDLKLSSDIALKRYKALLLSGRTPINKEGVITSDIGVFPTTGTMVNKFFWKENSTADTFSWFEFRISDVKFLRDDLRLKWYRIANNQRDIWKMNGQDGALRGKYYQWRAHLIPSPNGDRTPEIRAITMDYELDKAPEIPHGIEVMRTGDSSVILRWRKNADFDIGGYKIYYGVRPGHYDGVLRRVGGHPLTNDLTKGNYLAVEISNTLIEENREIDSGSVLEYPVLKNNVLYYFAVSAYDSYKPDTSFNHESKQSAEVSGRPWAGSEIQ